MPSTTTDGLKTGFGRRLRLARKARAYGSYDECARAAGVREQNLGNWERGYVYPQDMRDFERIVRHLGVTADFLLFGTREGLSFEAAETLRRASLDISIAEREELGAPWLLP